MKQQYIPVFRNPIDLYTSLGIPANTITLTDGFSLCKLGDPSIPTPLLASPVHRTGFYSFLFVKHASGQHWLNQYEQEVTPGSICFSNPGDITKLHFRDVREVYLLTLTESFLKEPTYPGIMQEFPFLQSEGLLTMVPGEEKFNEFERLYDQIRCVQLSQSALRKKQISCLVHLILLKIKEQKSQDPTTRSVTGAQTLIVSSFKLLLQQHYQNLHNGHTDRVFNVSEYADALGMHPNYLNQVIREKTGRPVSKWIIDKTISESKLLLAYSNLSVKEIAYRLGFTEASYFCRYFKKYTRLTAVEYRKTNY